MVSRDREQREHRVLRTEKEISALYAGMVDKFMSRGCVVPPPPEGKSKLLARYARYNKVGAVRTDETGTVNITRRSTTPILPHTDRCPMHKTTAVPQMSGQTPYTWK